MDRFIVAAFVATFIAAIAAVIGVPVLAQDLAPATNDEINASRATMVTLRAEHWPQ